MLICAVIRVWWYFDYVLSIEEQQVLCLRHLGVGKGSSFSVAPSWVSPLPGRAMGILGPLLVSRKLLCGASCHKGLWCNLLAEPLPELWVPLGVGKLPFVTSLPTVVPPGVQDTPLGPAASATGSSAWGTGEEGGALPGAPPYTVAATLPLLSFLSNGPGDFTGTRGYTAATMIRRKRSVSFGGFGWWVTEGASTEMRVDLENGSCWVTGLRGSAFA